MKLKGLLKHLLLKKWGILEHEKRKKKLKMSEGIQLLEQLTVLGDAESLLHGNLPEQSDSPIHTSLFLIGVQQNLDTDEIDIDARNKL